ncbi:hypothetical protein, partial [Rhodanobacter sp. 115]|uniref:hypothetical protein n=1 Tax=Rhodanobacter sp. FW021-MT20 TaxID=1162282 RepID=UPI001ED9770E
PRNIPDSSERKLGSSDCNPLNAKTLDSSLTGPSAVESRWNGKPAADGSDPHLDTWRGHKKSRRARYTALHAVAASAPI